MSAIDHRNDAVYPPLMVRGEIDWTSVGQRIRELRGDASQTDFGLGLGLDKRLSRQAVSNWENGRTNPAFNHLVAISLSKNVRLDWLLWGIPPKEVSAIPLEPSRLMAMASLVSRILQEHDADLPSDVIGRTVLNAYVDGDPGRVRRDLEAAIRLGGEPRRK